MAFLNSVSPCVTRFVGAALCIILSGCIGIPSATERRTLADRLAQSKGWQARVIQTGSFDLFAYYPQRHENADALAVYFEGDGFAWINASQPSGDPTPRDPLSLRLALAQPEGNAAYLARPCQYVEAGSADCPNRYWTEMRFAPAVVAASNYAVDRLKERFGAKRLTLVGYSGGGAIAALVAARRTDVELLITVAGNVDHQSWSKAHHLQPLLGSLNPADEILALSTIRQWHLVGAKDSIIPPALAVNFADSFPANRKPLVQIEPEFDHRCCWVEKWPVLWLSRPSSLPHWRL